MFHDLFKNVKDKGILFALVVSIVSFFILDVGRGKADDEYKKRMKEFETNLSKLEGELGTAPDQSHRDQLHLAIAELYTKFPYNFSKAWDHLMKVSDETPETERLCNLLWGCAYHLEAPALYSGNYKDLDWGPIKIAFE